jgi:hypothetical protein
MEFQVLKKYVSLLLLLTACRKDVTLKLPEYKEKLVIEGMIETDGPAYVLLSTSVPYFGDFDLNHPENSFVKGATVVIDDGNIRDTLREIDPAKGYFYFGTKVMGRVGKTYKLSVEYGGETYTVSSTIQKPVALDRLFFKGEKDSLGFMWQTLSEPAGIGNYYRWFAKRLHHDQFYSAPFTSVFDDKFIDGKTFDFSYNRGAQPNQLQDNRDDPERGYYKRGDTVVVKFCTLGEREFEFWDTYYQNRISNSNPFSAPANIKSMFDDRDKVFGAFVAYSPSYDTLIIPKK